MNTSYNDYQLTQEEIDALKRANQRQSVADYIKENGVEPDYATFLSFFTASTEQLETRKLALYSASYNPVPAHDYSQDYLTLVSLVNDNSFYSSDAEVYFSKDNGQTWVYDVSGVQAGSKVLVKGSTTWNHGSSTAVFSASGEYYVEGNIMSMIDPVNFRTATILSTESIFEGFFARNEYLVSAENLILPATSLTSLCYSSMFSDCTRLTTAPVLPAATLTYHCYYEMFKGCTSLNYVKCLATDTSAYECTSNWLNGVAASGTFVKAASMNDWTTGVDGIPNGWTIQNVS